MAASGRGKFDFLTRRHGIKIESPASVEVCSLAVGEMVGHEKVLSASRMNKAIVLFLETVELATVMVENGVMIDDVFTPVLPLSTPSKKVILSNVPPFIKDDILAQSLTRYGKLVSPIRKIAIASKNPLLKHVVSFRRYVHMILNDTDSEVDLTLNVKIEGFSYAIYATSRMMKCFGCGLPGHLLRDCPEKRNSSASGDDAQAGNVGEPPATDKENATTEQADTDVQPPEQAPVNRPTETPDTNSADQGASSDPVKENVEPENDMSMDSDASQSSVASVVHQGASALSDLTDDSSQNMDTDEASFKVPRGKKRTIGPSSSAAQSKKKDLLVELDGTDTESESDSEFNVTCSLRQSGFPSRQYSVEDIKSFLKKTKGARNVKLDEHFPDIEQFIAKTKLYMAESKFTRREGFRLVKILGKLRTLLKEHVGK